MPTSKLDQAKTRIGILMASVKCGDQRLTDEELRVFADKLREEAEALLELVGD